MKKVIIILCNKNHTSSQKRGKKKETLNLLFAVYPPTAAMQTALWNADRSSGDGTGAAALVLPGTTPVRREALPGAERSALGGVSRGSSSLKSPSPSKEQPEERLPGQPSTNWRAEGKGTMAWCHRPESQAAAGALDISYMSLITASSSTPSTSQWNSKLEKVLKSQLAVSAVIVQYLPHHIVAPGAHAALKEGTGMMPALSPYIPKWHHFVLLIVKKLDPFFFSPTLTNSEILYIALPFSQFKNIIDKFLALPIFSRYCPLTFQWAVLTWIYIYPIIYMYTHTDIYIDTHTHPHTYIWILQRLGKGFSAGNDQATQVVMHFCISVHEL